MGLIVVGLSHKNAPLDLREAMVLEAARLEAAYEELKAQDFGDVLLLSTCNRVEVYANHPSHDEGEAKLRAWLEALRPERAAQIRKSLIGLQEDEALWHLLQVAASLDSMVVGESQIFGQVKEAYEAAVAQKAVGSFFHGLFQKVFSAVKEVRTNTELGRHPASVPSVALQLAERVFGDLGEKCGILVGAGEMAELTAEYYKSAGLKRLIICNRSLSRAKELAKKFGAEARSLEALEASLVEADLAVFSASSSEAILDKGKASKIFQARGERPQLLIDIAVPRNVDPAIKSLESAYLYNIDDLSKIAEEHKELRLDASREAKSLLRKRYYEIREWIGAARVHPTIKALSRRLESLRRSEWEKQAPKLKHLGAQDLERVEYLTEAIVKKILDSPIRGLKASLQDGHVARHVESLETLFELEEES